tara:strand:+ start:2189 stop:2596 length:408 start_codon:yes stop_codon:yes gene_type:complete
VKAASDAPLDAPLRRNVGLSFLTLLASSGTLICCVLPAVMVSLGTGAALAGLVTAVPQLVWLSERKIWVFSLAALLLVFSGVMIWKARRLPCPADPKLARACMQLRYWSAGLWWVSSIAVAAGAIFAFLLPWWNA